MHLASPKGTFSGGGLILPCKNTASIFAYEKKGKTSQYKGVCWNKEKRKWCARVFLKGGKKKDGGSFKNEIDAAKRVNQLCQELGIPVKTPEISAIPDVKYQVAKKIFCSTVLGDNQKCDILFFSNFFPKKKFVILGFGVFEYFKKTA